MRIHISLLAQDSGPPAKDATGSKTSLVSILGLFFATGLVGFFANIIYDGYILRAELTFKVDNPQIINGSDSVPSETVNNIEIANNGTESATNLRITVQNSKGPITQVDKSFSTEKIDVSQEGSSAVGDVIRLAPGATVGMKITSEIPRNVSSGNVTSKEPEFLYYITANFDEGGFRQALEPRLQSVERIVQPPILEFAALFAAVIGIIGAIVSIILRARNR